MNRRRFLRQASASFVAALSTRCSSQTPTVGDRRTRIEQLMAGLHEQNEFTGEIVVAEKGHVIYAGAFGLADRSSGQPYTTDTRSCLASVSKPITATAIMMLELFVAFLQAFIFSLLASVFIGQIREGAH